MENDRTEITDVADAGLTKDGQNIFIDFATKECGRLAVCCTPEAVSDLIAELIEIAKQSRAYVPQNKPAIGTKLGSINATAMSPESSDVLAGPRGYVLVFYIGLVRLGFAMNAGALRTLVTRIEQALSPI